MKTGLLIILASVGLLVSVPHVFASESFHGKSSFENLSSELIPGKPTQFEIKFQYTSEPYALENLISIIDVNPASAKSYVQIDVKPIDVKQGQIVKIPVGITVDPQIEHKQIFLSVSFAGDHFSSRSDATYKSAWSDSVIIDIEKNLAPEPEQYGLIYENCEPGTTLQDGICVVDKTKENSTDTSVRWGGPAYNVESPLKQFNSGVPVDEIQCRETHNLHLNLKLKPVCIFNDSFIKLNERGYFSNQFVSNSFSNEGHLVLNSCSENSFCWDVENSTKIECIKPVHGCPPISFDDYKESMPEPEPKNEN